MCKAKEVNFIDKTDEDGFFIGTVKSDEAKQDDWCVKLKVNEHTISFKIDTGAQCNVVPVSPCRKVGIEYNHKTGGKLISYSGRQSHNCS
jgi:predicted aspartyl protease